MKTAVKWVLTHEPALLAGLIFGVSIFFAVRYGTHTSGAVQGLSGGTVGLAFAALRNFVTSPAGRKAIDIAQADVAQIPGLVADVNQLWHSLAPAIEHPSGLLGVLEAHAADVEKTVGDAVDRVHGMLRSQPAVPSVNASSGPQPAAAVAPAPPAPSAEAAPVVASEASTPVDALDQLGKLVA